jgi:hypothetical protein
LLPRPLPIAFAAAGVYALLLVATGPVDAQSSDTAVTDVSAAVDVPVAVPATEPTPDPLPSSAEPAPTATPSPEPPPPAEPVEPTPDVAAPGPAPSTGVADGAIGPGAETGKGADAPDVVAGSDAQQEHARPQEKIGARRGANTEARTGEIRPAAANPRVRARHVARGPRLGGTPALSAPAWLAGPIAPTPIAIPDFVIDGFGIPPFLLPIYQAAGMQYRVPWEVLAAINEIETNYGGNLNVSPAGARGWMQFMPSTWDMYGVDANRDGRKDPSNPVDAIFAAARYLHAAGADTDLRGAVFAYNHADWYVESVLERAQAIGRLPSDLVDSLAGLARGRFPVGAPATYAAERGAAGRGRTAALPSGGDRRSIEIFGRAGAPVIAVNDGRIVRITQSKRLGRFLRLRDVYGNTYTYAHLGQATGAKQGARVRAGATLGRLGRRSDTSPHLLFEIRPAGPGAPRIDPKPILDGWKLLESTAIHGAERGTPFLSGAAESPATGEIFLMSQAALTRRVLADPRVDIYGCGRSDIRSGQIDRRVLATLEFLAASGLAPTVSSLRCGHGLYTAAGNVSEHSTGSAVDIAAVNGIVISPATQGKGSITDLTIQRLLTLQGTMKPHQIISLMTFEGADNTFAMDDHDDHIHIGFRPVASPSPGAAWRPTAVLEPHQWDRLVDRIDELETPLLRRTGPD